MVIRTTNYLTPELQQGLREVAQRTGKRPAELIREAVEQFLRAEPQPLPRCIGAGEDAELAARDSEHWLRSHWGGT